MSKGSIHGAYRHLLQSGRLSANANQAALIDRLASLQTNLSKSTLPRKGIYIYGDVGTGKSRLADLFAATLSPNIPHRRIHFHEFMMDIHLRLHLARSSTSYSGDPLVRIGEEVRSEARVLCFDEFQVTDIADAMILKRLFGAFWGGGGVMVSTSNRHPENLYENGLNRPLFVPFIRELERRCEVWKLEGNRDYRMGGGTGEAEEGERETVFFTDPRGFEESLTTALHGEVLKPTVISVMMNRQLKVLAATRPEDGMLIASAKFRDLCEGFLGSSDYHALCKATGTLYLSGLRQFRADELDFVRRFITLIDLAYESRTRVVCLSTVSLFKLFEKIVPSQNIPVNGQLLQQKMDVRKGGGSSSSMMSTFIGGDVEWSATGLSEASLASGGAGETDVRFAVGRAVSRLFEMGSNTYGIRN